MTHLASECFDLKKAGQLVFFFLHKASLSGAHVTKLRLAKWLYLAERGSYEEFGEPLVGDRLASLRHGPVPSELVAIIEGRSRRFDSEEVSRLISTSRESGRQYVELVPNAGYSSPDDLDRFSEAEMEMLEGIWRKYGNWSAVGLETHLHDRRYFPEWEWEEGDGTNWIELEKILSVVGFDAKDIGPMVQSIMAFGPVSSCEQPAR